MFTLYLVLPSFLHVCFSLRSFPLHKDSPFSAGLQKKKKKKGFLGLPCCSVVKSLPVIVGDMGWMSGL